MKVRFGQSTLVLLAMIVSAFVSAPEGRRQTSCLATTTNGMVQGIDNGVSCSFLGIPFAAPPLGNLRWKPPQPAAPWPTTLNATAGVACPQVNPAGSTTVMGNENCLKLNVWTPDPAPASPAPVIVWIHTGAFMAASPNIADSNPRSLVELTGAIVVAANYRIGPLGFMGHPALTAEDPAYHSSGNYGLLDQRAAMAWVRDNIAAFGGDPDNVTIAGQSAGGHSVSFHIVSPGSASYFHRAIIQSGYASARQPTLTDAEALGTGFAATVGCNDPAQVLACMRAKTPVQVLLAFPNGQQEFAQTPRIAWGPVVDGLDIPDQPRSLYENGAFNRVPTIIGSTRDEGWIYADRSYPGGLTTAQYEAAVDRANSAHPLLRFWSSIQPPISRRQSWRCRNWPATSKRCAKCAESRGWSSAPGLLSISTPSSVKCPRWLAIKSFTGSTGTSCSAPTTVHPCRLTS